MKSESDLLKMICVELILILIGSTYLGTDLYLSFIEYEKEVNSKPLVK